MANTRVINCIVQATGTSAYGASLTLGIDLIDNVLSGATLDLVVATNTTVNAYGNQYATTSISGTLNALAGDRSAWDTTTYFDRHASDIDDATFTYHNDPASPPLGAALTNTHIFVGNASNVATDVAMSNDATMANTGALTLATVNSNVGTFGSATQVSQVTVNAKGLVTAAANVTITAGHTIQNQGVTLPTEPNLNFAGSGVIATDNAGASATNVQIETAVNVYNETQIADGIRTIYYLANYATPGAIRVYIDGIRQPASDDSVPTDIVSFSVAPDLGAVLLFDYEMDLT